MYMKFILTNDDGYNAKGILLLKEKLSKYGDVTIVAPYKHMSGKSVSITLSEWLKVDRIDEKTYAVHGTPTDCACMALAGLKLDCDIFVSGCNDGPNLSYDVLLSGTVGACLGAMVFKKKTVAISAPHGDYSCLIDHFDEIWEFITNNDLLSENYCLNINLPKEGYKGIKIGRCYYRNDYYYYDKKDDDMYFALRDVEGIENMPEDADCRLVKEGYVAVVPISRLPYNEEDYQKIKQLLFLKGI